MARSSPCSRRGPPRRRSPSPGSPPRPGGPFRSPIPGSAVSTAAASDPASTPRFLHRDGQPWAGARLGPADLHGSPPPEGARLKSIVAFPSPPVNHPLSSQAEGDDGGWTEVTSRKSRKAGSRPLDHAQRHPSQRSDRRWGFNAAGSREAFLSQFRGKCFRCLSKLHRRVDCRDPLRCIICKRAGHFGKECPQNPKNGGPGGPVRARLGPQPPRIPVRDCLCFPPAPVPTPMDRLLHCYPARRPRFSNKVIMATPALERDEFILRQHAVTLSAADHRHSTNPMAVGKAILEQLSTPAHLLRVTAHHPEAFLVHFDLPAHRDDAVRRGVLKIDGSKYFVRAWHEDDHAAILKMHLHVRVVVEDLPMQLWSLQGAEEAFGDFGRIDCWKYALEGMRSSRGAPWLGRTRGRGPQQGAPRRRRRGAGPRRSPPPWWPSRGTPAPPPGARAGTRTAPRLTRWWRRLQFAPRATGGDERRRQPSMMNPLQFLLEI